MWRLAAAGLATAVLAVAALLASTGGWRARSAPVAREKAPATPGALELLVARLRDPSDLDARVEAAVALRGRGEEAVPAFCALLRDGDVVGRRIAARSLGRMGAIAATGTGALVEALHDSDVEVRLLAIDALREVGAKDVGGALLPLLREADAAIVRAALDLLRDLKPHTAEAALAIAAVIDPARGDHVDRAALEALEAMGPAAAPALPRLLAAFENESLLSPAIDAVGAIGPEAHPAVPALVRVVLDEERREEEERARILESLDVVGCRHGPFPALDARDALVAIGESAIPQVLAMLAHELYGVRYIGSEILSRVGAPALPHLVAAASHPDVRVRAAAAAALGGKWAKDHPDLVAVLSRLAGDAEPSVRESAVKSLGAFGEHGTEALLAALGDGKPSVVQAALWSLRRSAPRDPAAVPRLVRLLGHTDSSIRWGAAAALAAMGDAAESAVPALVACLDDECRYMRESAREALAGLGERTVPALLAALDRARPEAQIATITLVGARSDEARAACLRMLASPDPSARVHAAATLALHDVRDDALLPHLVAGLRHPDAPARRAATQGLERLGPLAAASLQEILEAAVREGEREGGASVHFYDALAAVGREAPEALAAALSHESWNVRYDASQALAKIGEAAVPAVARVLAGGPFDARDAAAEILGKIASTSGAARAALEAALADPAPEIRLSVLKELWRGTKDPRAVVPGLLELVRSGPESCRATAAYHLSQIGSGASFAIRELRAAHARAGDEQVATYLARAIEAVERR